MTISYDVFNGDADGICALHQLRLAEPSIDSIKVTGVKRDIKLLAKIENIKDCSITVLDVSLDSNRDPLNKLLQNNNSVFYVDHHFCGDIPQNNLLTTKIDTSPETCTSLLINNYLENKYLPWAICGAFGDNLHGIAQNLSETIKLSQSQTSILKDIGELLNYNGYGTSIDDLHISPESLYDEVHQFESPFDFYAESEILSKLQTGYESDMSKALEQKELYPNLKNRLYQLPDIAWARRISGVFANLKAREKKDSAHALITMNKDNTWRISVRAPLSNRSDADTLCKQFPTGGGRSAAAGINSLPNEMFETFIQAFQSTYP